jgi:hypothetical protein
MAVVKIKVATFIWVQKEAEETKFVMQVWQNLLHIMVWSYQLGDAWVG